MESQPAGPAAEAGSSAAGAVWALTDGRAGNLAQALGLAEALERRLGLVPQIRTVLPRRWAAALPARVWAWIPPRGGGWPFSGLAAGVEALRPPWPRLIVSAGRRAAPIAAALRRLEGVPAVQILDPDMRLDAFDLVILPDHDARQGPRVVATLGSLGRVTPAAIAPAAAALAPRLPAAPGARVAALIGGPSRSARWAGGEAEAIAAALERLAAEGTALLVTTSRRTPPGLAARLARLPPPAWVWDGTGPNPYPGLLGLAEAVLVTADSVNMASEAAASGLPVHVLPGGRLAPKLARFHAGLAAQGAARPFAGRIERWSYPPLAEADRVAAVVANRLGLSA